MTRVSYLIVIVLIASQAYAQIGHLEKSKKSRLNVTMGHSHIPSAVQSGSTSNLVLVPSWGIGYTFNVTEKFGIGLKSDFEFSNYVIEDEEGTEMEREYPIALSLSFEYKIVGEFGLSLAPGIEFEKEENLIVGFIGAFYEVEMGTRWDFTPEILYQTKGGHTGAIILGFGLGL